MVYLASQQHLVKMSQALIILISPLPMRLSVTLSQLMPKLTHLMSLLAADGNVTVDILAAKATDTAGNNNTAATGLTRTADLTALTANLGAISNITTAGGTSQTLTVTFSDSSGVDVSSLDNSDVVVNWSGGAIPATFVSVDINSNGTPRTATYSFTPPGGIGIMLTMVLTQLICKHRR
jgi:hypothetical protein